MNTGTSNADRTYSPTCTSEFPDDCKPTSSSATDAESDAAPR
jgi:hypothetical protein